MRIRLSAELIMPQPKKPRKAPAAKKPVVPDGVFVRGDDGHVVFRRLPAPDDDDIDALLRQCASRVLRLLRRELDDDEPDADALAALEAASLKARPAVNGDGPKKERLTAFLEGFSLHAGVHLHANDRRGLEQLCRYGARGAIALSRLSELPDGRVAYHMKRALHGRPWRASGARGLGGCPRPDGRTHLVLTGVELLRKLAPLIPPPRLHLLRFHGVLAANSKLRSQVVPKPPAPAGEEAAPADKPRARTSPSPYRLDWAAALRRVFEVDILMCALRRPARGVGSGGAGRFATSPCPPCPPCGARSSRTSGP